VLIATGLACRDAAPTDRLRLAGHVEATEVRVAPEIGGRIVDLRIDEGRRTEVGEIVAVLDTADTELALDRAEAERQQAEAQWRLLRAGARDEDVRQAEAQQAAAEAELAIARAELDSARLDLERFDDLWRRNSGSRKQRDDAATGATVTEERVRAAEQRVRAATEAVRRLRAGAREQEIAAARARLAAAEASIATLRKTLADAVVRAPVTGVVTEKLVEAGEVIAPRTPMAIITDLEHAWANVYVDEPMVPRIRVGQPATVFTDAGGPGLDGTVSYVSPRAEFTPRNVQTAEERSKLVYRIKITTNNIQGVLKPGMPVEAEVPLQPLEADSRADPSPAG
jgi:HlyD family secretion protein